MKKSILCLIISQSLLLFPCTTILVTKGATQNESFIVSHSDDDEMQDPRIVYVPAQDYPAGAKRAITPLASSGFPRYAGKERGPGYAALEGYPDTPITGYIDQVAHTYAYFDGMYGIVNEKGLALGECTCASKYQYKPNDKLIFDITNLTQIALERCTTAKEAILLMGSLAEKYGYFDWGELILLADENEGWVFEISASPKGEGALWVAKKVPDGEVFISTNIFRIREVLPESPDMLYSSNLFNVAKEQKWIKKGKLDWLTSVSPGEYNHPYYSLRRLWRAQTLFNPSLHLPSRVANGYTEVYPFSIKPAKKLTVQDVMACHRDYFQGTPFDLTKGLAAGPFGCPYRYVGPYEPAVNSGESEKKPPFGAWERPISVYYCGYSYVTEIRPSLPKEIGIVTWLSLDQPATSCYMPLYLGMNDLPWEIQTGSPEKFNRKTPFWAFNLVSNLAALKFSYIIQDINQKQGDLEGKAFEKQADIDQKALDLYQEDPQKAKDLLTDYCMEMTKTVVQQWWQLSTYLIEKYADGYINKPHLTGTGPGYPKEWLEQVGYKKGPLSY